MIVFPNCKINLGLHVVEKRKDGFHNIETVFYPLPLYDALEVVQSDEQQLTTSGLDLDVNADDNICSKAYHLLKKDFPQILPIKIHLHKVIPSGAGLGGGSADAAFMLLLLNKKFNLQLTEEQLMNYALTLGSDCPFFIKNIPSIATGRGEILEKIDLNLKNYKVVLVNPSIHINTAWAFRQLKPKAGRMSLKEIVKQPVSDWKSLLINDFEEAVFSSYPEIKQIKDQLYNGGALYASMSGSGSSVYGIFEKDFIFQSTFPTNNFLKEINLNF